jgi:hypothetical protein
MLSKPRNLKFTVAVVLTNTKTGANGINTSNSLTKTNRNLTRMSRTIFICLMQSNKTAHARIRVISIRLPANFIRISGKSIFLPSLSLRNLSSISSIGRITTHALSNAKRNYVVAAPKSLTMKHRSS